jgi:hypothetical protein
MYLSWWRPQDPFYASSHVIDAVVQKVKTEGFRIGTDIMFKKQNKLYMNVMLFNEYISTILLPYIARGDQILGVSMNQRFF